MPELASIAELIMGQSPPSSTYNEVGDGLPFFQGKSDFGFRHPTPRLFCNIPQKIAKPNDILLSVRAPVGPTNITDQECCIGRGLAAIRPRTIDGDFLFFNLRYVERLIASLGSGSTFHAINKTQLGSVEVNENGFDLPEQRKIAGVLGLAQRAMEQQERLLQLTAELKKALLHHLFTQGLRGEPQKQTEIGLVPESWEEVSVGSLVDITHGYAFASRHFTTSGPIVLTPGNFKLDGGLYWGDRTKFTTETCAEEYVLRCPDLVVVMTDLTPSAKLLGTPAFIPDDKVILHNQRIGKIVTKSNRTMPEFLYWVFLTDLFKKHMVLTATGSTVRHTSPSRIKNYKFALPPKDEQEELANILNAFDGKLQLLEAKRNAFTDLFRTLLDQLMTAKIRVHDLDLTGLN